ncbi:glycosyltransferase family 4 protein [Marinobacter sp. TBZ242]|uniref:Glycosyltransferase family 4 protein n=1 Tax=Marinobacter azerbaijanicus TaxID=3050455 RepID=A0ABT7I6G4_9GAMM|nr:glycosyltransferase family 4 protein [Marinobacter sp. TBZ242]MDL0429699.1 glycosyltransferase family 4 protein [Marinobacter sp. TBZ242]
MEDPAYRQGFFVSLERRISVLVEIVYTLSGRGLVKDADLLKDVIGSLGHDVSINALPRQHPLLTHLSGKWGRATKRIPSPRLLQMINSLQRKICRLFHSNALNADLVIHLENIHPRYINPLCPNWLIPNQEWFRPERIHYLEDIQSVLCKTHAAKECFKSLHPDVRFLGFSAPIATHLSDWQPPDRNPDRILHVAGSSPFKGTDVVLEAWKKNPEWPCLTLVANIPQIGVRLPPNVVLKSNLSEPELQALWQEAAIVVNPSEVEGYGQVLAEAMCYGAVVITTDSPPMNELVSNDRGYLVPYTETACFRLGMRYKVSAENLEQVVNRALNDSGELRAQKARNALDWTRDNHEAFIRRLEHYLNSAIPNAGSADQSSGQSQA